eukprot:jgi/Mesen1/10291/ME000079S09706
MRTVLFLTGALVLSLLYAIPLVSGGLTKPRLHIPNDLDDVIDDEEDENWQAWGKDKQAPSLERKGGGLDSSKVNTASRAKGSAFGFVKLQHDPLRPKEDVKRLAHIWTNILHTGQTKARFYPIDSHTMYVKIEDDRQIKDISEFVLEQYDAYELKIGDEFYRRAGDPPLSDVAKDPKVWDELSKLNSQLLDTQYGAKRKPQKDEL